MYAITYPQLQPQLMFAMKPLFFCSVCLLNGHVVYLNWIHLHSWWALQLHNRDPRYAHILAPKFSMLVRVTHTLSHMLSCVTISDWPHLSYVTALCGALPALWCFRVTGWVNVSKCVGASILCSITTEWVWLQHTAALIWFTHLAVQFICSCIFSPLDLKMVCLWVSTIFIVSSI